MGGCSVKLVSDLFGLAVLSFCACALFVMAVACACVFGSMIASALRRRLSARRLVALAVVAAVCTWAAQKRGTVSFPRTDPLMEYISDRGSYTTNDYVHVDFTRVIVPDTATWFLDRRALTQTNDADWATFSTGTFGEWNPPRDFLCANATNYNWLFYTDWTPGPSVQTNGVWHAFWGKDRRFRSFYIPLRTCVRKDAGVIATPKSKEDNQ